VQFVQAELELHKSSREKVLMRVISLMALNSLRVAFDKWSLAVASAAHERMLAEEAAKKEELLADVDAADSDDDDAGDDELDSSAAGDSSAVKEYVRFRKKKLRQAEKLRRQVMSMRRVCVIGVY
jgi:hypothetical protein